MQPGELSCRWWWEEFLGVSLFWRYPREGDGFWRGWWFQVECKKVDKNLELMRMALHNNVWMASSLLLRVDISVDVSRFFDVDKILIYSFPYWRELSPWWKTFTFKGKQITPTSLLFVLYFVNANNDIIICWWCRFLNKQYRKEIKSLSENTIKLA
jgi:hypothetical protein